MLLMAVVLMRLGAHPVVLELPSQARSKMLSMDEDAFQLPVIISAEASQV